MPKKSNRIFFSEGMHRFVRRSVHRSMRYAFSTFIENSFSSRRKPSSPLRCHYCHYHHCHITALQLPPPLTPPPPLKAVSLLLGKEEPIHINTAKNEKVKMDRRSDGRTGGHTHLLRCFSYTINFVIDSCFHNLAHVSLGLFQK